jgi:predicted outer membrane repeat protein
MKNHKYTLLHTVLIAILIMGNLAVQPAKAAEVDFGWAQSWGGQLDDWVAGTALDESGNVFTIGTTMKDADNSDIFISKRDPNGNTIWSKEIGGSSRDQGLSIAVDENGSVLITGHFSETVDFDPGVGVSELTSAGWYDVFIAKLDSNGDFVWAKRIGGTLTEWVYDLTLDSNGNVYTTGRIFETVDFDPGIGVYDLIVPFGGEAMFVSKLDAQGDFVWAKGVIASLHIFPMTIAADAGGNVFTSGCFDYTVDFDPGVGVYNLTSVGEFSCDVFISKLDANGDFVWAKSMGGSVGHTLSEDITVDLSGNIYTTGYFNDTVDFDPGAGIFGLTSIGNIDIFVSKLDSMGSFIWAKGMGGIGGDRASGIDVDLNGNIYTTGGFNGTVDFDPGAGIYNLTSLGDSDIFISQLDSNGNFVWAKSIGGVGSDVGGSIVLDSANNVFVTGSFRLIVDFNPGAGTNNLTSAGESDIFITKLATVPQTHYVKWNATGANNGTSWANAYKDLQSALAAAASGDEIWVAAGTYKPTSTNDRTLSFALKNGVALYGGFAGTETARSQRNVAAYLTVLSGEIGLENDDSDNSYHVIVGSDTDNSAILDGFTVTGGNADGAGIGADAAGGGMYTLTGSPTVRNVKFIDNFANFGGGMFNAGLDGMGPDTPGSHPVLTNVVFENNSAVAGGGGMRNMNFSHPVLKDVVFKNNDVTRTGGGLENFNSSSPTLTDVTFDGNTAGASGGGLYNWIGNSSSLTNVSFINNSADFGGGMGNYESNPVLTNVTFTGNSAITRGGGIFSESYSKPVLTDVVLSANTADVGGGMFNLDGSSPELTNVTFSGNSANWYGGGMGNENDSSPSLTNVSFTGNTADSNTKETAAGALHNRSNSSPSLTNVTFKNNFSNYIGGGMVNELSSSPKLVNVTFNGNVADYGGAMVNRDTNSNPTLTHVTMSGNIAYGDGGAIANNGNPVIVNSILWGNTGGEIYNLSGTPAVSYSIVQGGHTGDGNLDEDPVLGLLQDNGGLTETMAPGEGSPAIDAAQEASCPSSDQRGVTRPQGTACDMGAYESDNSTIDVTIGTTMLDSYWLAPKESTRVSYAGVNNGPVKITNTNNVSIMAAERVIYKTAGGQGTSFTEMMGLPNSQLDTTYWLPWYNNTELDTQLRFANVSASPATVRVYIGGQEMSGSPFTLAAGESTRRSFPGVSAGPVKIESNVNIVAAERVVYKVNGLGTSFTEMMALPNSQLDTTYWLPWYNNVELDTQLRFANVGGMPGTVHVYIGGQEMQGSPFTLAAGESTRKSFAGISNGPVRIESDVNIVAAERVVYKTGNTPVSFSEMMALPDRQLDTTYWFPWYNNGHPDLDTQLRFANVSGTPATVRIYIGEEEMPRSPFTLVAGESTRKSFPGVNNGPVKIISDVPIVAAERVVYRVSGTPTSFSELMGLPNALLDATFWFPWYNNATAELDTQLRFGIP